MGGPSVTIGICQDNQDLDLNPICFNLPAIKAQETCSPVDNRESYSALSKLLLINLDLLTSSLVTPLIAEEITTTLFFLFLYEDIILHTFLILSILPTEVPP